MEIREDGDKTHMQKEEKKNCLICGSESYCQSDYSNIRIFYVCPTCGRYETGLNKFDRNKMGPYLFYNRFDGNDLEYRYHTTLEKELCDQYRKEFEEGNNTHGMPVHMDNEIIERWYPSSFSEKLDYIVRYTGEHTRHAGQRLVLSYQEVLSLLFVDREDETEHGQMIERNSDDCQDEIKFMLDCLQDSLLITYAYGRMMT